MTIITSVSINGATFSSVFLPLAHLILTVNLQAYLYTNLIDEKTKDPLACKWQHQGCNLFECLSVFSAMQHAFSLNLVARERIATVLKITRSLYTNNLPKTLLMSKKSNYRTLASQTLVREFNHKMILIQH